jgi:peptidoglycan hydrolase-like protein with peptidoglycan-binding domain
MGRSECLVRLLAASMLVIGAAPASALAGSVSGQHAKPPTIQIKQRLAHEHHSGVVMAPGSGYASRGGAARVRALQRRLARAGFAPGPIDGRYGPRTEQAVSGFQVAHGLQVDGIAGPLTLAALSRPSVVLYPGTGYVGHGSGAVRALQRRLTRAGFAPGPIDGRYGPRTEQAVSRHQAAHGLQVDGIAGPQTLAHLPNQSSTPHLLTHRTRPADTGGSRPHTTHRQPTPAPSTRSTVPASHSTSSPQIGLLVLLAALAVALGLAVATIAYRRAEQRGDATRAFNLGVQLEEKGDRAGALTAFRRAGQHGSREVAEMAHAILLELDGGNGGPGAEESRGGHEGAKPGATHQRGAR